MIKRNFVKGTRMTAEQALAADSLGIVLLPPHGWVVYISQPEGLAHYLPDDADSLADIYAKDARLAKRIAPAIREFAEECRMMNLEGNHDPD